MDSLDKRIAAKISGFGPSSFGGSDATSAHSASTTTFSGQLALMEEKVAAKAGTIFVLLVNSQYSTGTSIPVNNIRIGILLLQ